MRKIIATGAIVIAAILLSPPLKGQRLLRSIQNRVEQKLEERAEEKILDEVDKKVDEALDSLEKNSGNAEEKERESREERNQQRMNRFLKRMGMSGEPVPIADNYAFEQLVAMHIESFDPSGKMTSSGDINLHFNPDQANLAYEVVSGDLGNSGQGMFIIDTQNSAIIMLSSENGEKTGIAYGMESFMQSMGESYDQAEKELSDSPETWLNNPNVTKTGRTRTIAGYRCEEYKYNDEQTESEIWVTRDLKLNSKDFMSTLFKTSLYSHGIGWGYIMAATSVEKSTGEKSTMEVTRVDKNSHISFNMKDYAITNLGSITIPQTEEEKSGEQK